MLYTSIFIIFFYYSIDSFGKTEKKNFGKKITDCMQKNNSMKK